MASASTHSSATSSRSWLGSRRWAPYPGELSVSVKYPNFIVASSLRPLSAQIGVRRQGHEGLGAPLPELRGVGKGGHGQILDGATSLLHLQDVDRVDDVLEGVEAHPAARSVELHGLQRGEERGLILDVPLHGLERSRDGLRAHVALLGHVDGRALVLRGVRLHAALVLARVHGGNSVNDADDPHGGLADLGQHVALGEALADERDLALQAVLLVLLHEADRVDAGEERRHHVGIAPDLAEERREIRDRKSTRLNSSHTVISYAVFCLKKKKITSPRRSIPDRRSQR